MLFVHCKLVLLPVHSLHEQCWHLRLWAVGPLAWRLEHGVQQWQAPVRCLMPGLLQLVAATRRGFAVRRRDCQLQVLPAALTQSNVQHKCSCGK